MENPKQQIIDRLNQATNILVTVSLNPSVDQLAGAIGLTLLLNKLGKHATAVFSGQTPSTIEFLQPDKTLETNTNSLRDFIIALDKSKADKLRYKVEDQMVKIFITPYRTSISDKDLEFSQGDFNVEVVVAIGVEEQSHLDQAITSHGRILHDATIIGINTKEGSTLGSINWNQPDACSLSEMLVALCLDLKPDGLDTQMATAFLTGIVAETNRFSNEKTTSAAMQMSAKLMNAGANQQLIATQLQTPTSNASDSTAVDGVSAELPDPGTHQTPAVSADGSLLIDHQLAGSAAQDPPQTDDISDIDKLNQIDIDETGQIKLESDPQDPHTTAKIHKETRTILEPPSTGGQLTANTEPEALDPSTDPLGATEIPIPLLSHDATPETAALQDPPTAELVTPDPQPAPNLQDVFGATSTSDLEPIATPPGFELPASPSPLPDIEKLVDDPQPHEPSQNDPIHLDDARDAVNQVANGVPDHVLAPIQALNAQPMDLNLGDMPAVATSPASAFADSATPTPFVPEANTTPDPNAPPPVPPPMMPLPIQPFQEPTNPQ